MRRRRWVWIVALVIFLADRGIKIAVATHMSLGQSIPIAPPVLWITYITNSGAAFSLFDHGRPLFVVIGLVILLGLAFYLPRASRVTPLFGVGAGLLAGGTAGNMWDRVLTGHVIDYVHFRFFAIFNLADAAIVVGIILIVWDFWRRDRAHAESVR